MKITGSNLHALYVQSIGSDKLNVEIKSSLSRQQDLYFACLVRVKMTTVVNKIDKKWAVSWRLAIEKNYSGVPPGHAMCRYFVSVQTVYAGYNWLLCPKLKQLLPKLTHFQWRFGVLHLPARIKFSFREMNRHFVVFKNRNRKWKGRCYIKASCVCNQHHELVTITTKYDLRHL